MCDKAVNTCCFFVFHPVPDQYKCTNVIFEDPFILTYCPGRYKTQKMCDEAVDDCLAVLKFVHDWFVKVKFLKSFMVLCSLMMICLFMKSILVKSHFLLIKWVFFV